MRRVSLAVTIVSALILAAGCSSSSAPRTATVASSPSSGVNPTSATGQTTGVIGYVGCSNTHDAIGGYEAAGGKRFWPVIGAYQGGTVALWAAGIKDPSNAYWTSFKQALAAQPTTTFWFQFCAHPQDSEQTNYDGALAVIAEIQRLVPGAVVYVSPINGFVAPHVCELTGADGPALMKALADRLATEGKALRGPDVGDLLSFGGKKASAGATAQNDQTTDDCHPNDAGRLFLGKNLRSFPAFSD